jgi:hypothetical protein
MKMLRTLRTLRHLSGSCAKGVRAGAHLTVSTHASVEGARRVLDQHPVIIIIMFLVYYFHFCYQS